MKRINSDHGQRLAGVERCILENNGGTHPWARRVIKSGVFKGLTSVAELIDRLKKYKNSKFKGAVWEIFRKFYMTQYRGVSEFYYAGQIPREILEQFKLPEGDKGIDCVYRDVNGNWVAGQDKVRMDASEILPWSSLSTFWGLAEYFSHLSVFTNCKGVAKLLYKKDGWSLINDFSDIPEELMLSIHDWLCDGRKVKVTPLEEDRKHQMEAVRRNVLMFHSHGRLTNVLPCGAGKTAIAILTLKELSPTWGVLWFPSVSLLSQTQKEFVKYHHSGDQWRYLAVTHDTTVTSDMDLYNDTADDCEFAVTTNPEKLREQIEEIKDQGLKGLIFSTYHSADVVAEASKHLISFDLGIFDEAHWTAGRRNKDFAKALYDSNIDIKKRLFLTATPAPNDGSPNDYNSMDNEEMYGSRSYEMSFRQGIDDGIICPYKVIGSSITTDDVDRELLKVGEIHIKGDYEHCKLVADCMTLYKAMEEYNLSKFFVFTNSCVNSRDFRRCFEKMYPDVQCFYLDGAVRSRKRNEILAAFAAAPKAIIVNVDILTEGIDVPNADGVFFTQPRSSVRSIVQAVGRVLRPYDEKEYGYILIPTYVHANQDESVEEATLDTNYGITAQVLNALGRHDNELMELLLVSIREVALTGNISPHSQAILGEILELARPEMALDDLRDSIELQIISRLIPDHVRHFEILKDRFEKDKSWNFLKDSKSELGQCFADFISNLRQRCEKETSVLNQYLPWLQENNFPLGKTREEIYHNGTFMPSFIELEKQVEDGKKWGNYDSDTVSFLRCSRSLSKKHAKGKKTYQTNEQRKMLDNLLGTIWRDPQLEKFLNNIEKVRKNPKSKWAITRLADWRQSKDRFDKTRLDLLNDLFKDIGATWEKTPRYTEEEKNQRELESNEKKKDKQDEKLREIILHEFKMIEECKAFKKKHKHLIMTEDMPQHLQNFLNYQRALKKGSITRKITKGVLRATELGLNALDFVWDQKDKVPKISTLKSRKQSGFRFSVTFNGVSKSYSSKSLEALEKHRDTVMKAGKHIPFPKVPWNKKNVV